MNKIIKKFEIGNWYQCTKDFFGKGVTFDFEKKELKKIEQNFSWSKEDDNCLSTIIAEFSKCAGKSVSKDEWMRCNDFLNSLRDRVQPKQDWSEEDERMIISIVNHLEKQKNYQLNSTNIEQCQEWLKSLKDRVQLKQEYSEEDERTIKRIDSLLYAINESDFKDIHAWLESLKNKVQPSPKQEWSEDDEDYINDLVKYFSQNEKMKNTKEDIVIWLKSLKGRYTWKPSGEQMEALKSSTYCQDKQMSKVLFELYQDLKKLKKE